MNKEKKNIKKSWIKNGIFVAILAVLYITGLHTEVIGFAQRGLLATGLMNPDIEEIAHVQNNENETNLPQTKTADLNLKLMDSEGNISSLENLKGKVIFMNYWATWCPPCVAEMPSINKLYEEMGDDVAFVMISFDKDFEKAKSFNKSKGYNFPIYTLASNIPEMFESSALPTTFIIDAKGNLALTHKGMADYNTSEFKEFLNGLK
ncbi:thiol-disulfide isomerase/thioredoxin [Mariniflexile fucanivorans]|uniref:Thiol-disulfide isomerase/thioredoxin n=1 Tax=Mariniflexile fucanivorans TaxID=264023 RepID=A0A4R1RNB0_9FLAO|nr:TlpA disulfide reductase family protein [Mariniflexile fucanivorans]TCL67629.1 thiol-disulfide isomerase/thioredoxin [Mariniflexile fucanivorans]